MPKSDRYHIDEAEIVVLPQKGCHNSLFHPRIKRLLIVDFNDIDI
jgi:hypothetical protein